MACFLVPAAEAVITTAAASIIKSKEARLPEPAHCEECTKTPFSKKMGWLNNMLWGGSGLLAFEHIWHGEVSPAFPFLTAVSEGQTSEMLSEMGTAGVAMSVMVTAVWGVMVYVTSRRENRAAAGEAGK